MLRATQFIGRGQSWARNVAEKEWDVTVGLSLSSEGKRPHPATSQTTHRLLAWDLI